MSLSTLSLLIASTRFQSSPLAYPTFAVYTPAPSTWVSSTSLNIELVGDKSVVDDAIKKISERIGALKDVPADWLVHRIILHKNAKK